MRTFGDDHGLELSFLRSPLHDFTLDRMLAHESEHQHGPRLSYPVCTVLSLEVHLRVLYIEVASVSGKPRVKERDKATTHPVLIIKDDGIRRGQRDTQASRSCTEQKQSRRVRFVASSLEPVHLCSTIERVRRAVDAAQRPALEFSRPVLDRTKGQYETRRRNTKEEEGRREEENRGNAHLDDV